MIRPHPWTDGYVAIVAHQLLFEYGATWNRLTDVDPALSQKRMRDLLAAIRAAGNPIDDESPSKLPTGAAVEAEVEQLYLELQAVRVAAARVFAAPSQALLRIAAICQFPRTYRGAPDEAMVPASEVEIIHMGDTPPSSPAWSLRSEIGRFRSLRSLSLFNCELGGQRLGIDLGALPRLESLDLSENGLTRLPDEVLAGAQLEFLALRDNPLTELPDLTPLGRLRYLALSRTGLPSSTIQRARAQMPSCEIESS